MRLLDSNIIIYAADPQGGELRNWLRQFPSSISIISEVEVLGYHLLQPEELTHLRIFLDQIPVIPLTSSIARQAISLRQKQKIGLADALIAATAIELQYPLVTRNVADFKRIEGLHLINPFSPA